MNAIYILWLRQLKRYFRSRSRLIGSLGQPLLFLVALGFGFGPIYQRAGGGSYIQFLTPGIIAMSVLFTSMFSGIEIIWDRQFGCFSHFFPGWFSLNGFSLSSVSLSFYVFNCPYLYCHRDGDCFGFRRYEWVPVDYEFFGDAFIFLIRRSFSLKGFAKSPNHCDEN